jgi:aryl-phospho-beta-D-glucosidase BglC (GH1 family)
MQKIIVTHVVPFPIVFVENFYRLSSFNRFVRYIFYCLTLFTLLLPKTVMASNQVSIFSKTLVHSKSSSTSTITLPDKILSATDFQALKLRGVNISSRVLLNETDFQSLASFGAKLVRMSISLNRCSTCTDYGISSNDLAYAKQVISYGAKYKFHVVLALTPLPDGNKAEYWDNPTLQMSIIQNWQKVASTFRNEPVVIGYDLINEPVPPGNTSASQAATWINFASQLIPAIRRVDREHAIIVEVAPWDLPKGFSQLTTPLPFPNLIYSLHFYDPHELTHQGLPNVPGTYEYPSAANSGIGAWDKARLSTQLDPVRAFSRKYQVPIYVGEFSSIRWAPNNSSYRYIKDVTELFDAEGWSWTYHQYRGWNGWDAEIPSPNPANTQRTTNSPIFTYLHNEFLLGQ